MNGWAAPFDRWERGIGKRSLPLETHAHDPLSPIPTVSVAERFSARRLGELLVEREVVTPAQLEHALSTRLDRRERLGQALVRLGHLQESDVAEALARQFSLALADVEKL